MYLHRHCVPSEAYMMVTSVALLMYSYNIIHASQGGRRESSFLLNFSCFFLTIFFIKRITKCAADWKRLINRWEIKAENYIFVHFKCYTFIDKCWLRRWMNSSRRRETLAFHPPFQCLSRARVWIAMPTFL